MRVHAAYQSIKRSFSAAVPQCCREAKLNEGLRVRSALEDRRASVCEPELTKLDFLLKNFDSAWPLARHHTAKHTHHGHGNTAAHNVALCERSNLHMKRALQKMLPFRLGYLYKYPTSTPQVPAPDSNPHAIRTGWVPGAWVLVRF